MVSLRPKFLRAFVRQVRAPMVAQISMKTVEPSGRLRRSLRAPLRRSSAVLTALLFLLVTAKSQPVSYAFNNGLGKFWRIASWQSPDSKPGLNHGTYVPENVDFVDGILRLKVEQTQGPDGVISKGGAVWTKAKFGYGTYEFVMRMASESPTPYGTGQAQSGTVSSAFLYLQNSQTEMDTEFLGDKNSLWATNWHNLNFNAQPQYSQEVRTTDEVRNASLANEFHDYRVVWQPESVKWYIDGVLVASHSTNVPVAPAYVILQIRGTNSDQWGGKATLNVIRYAYVKSVKFYPA
jgi:beta-glucanase (GH16 family)